MILFHEDSPYRFLGDLEQFIHDANNGAMGSSLDEQYDTIMELNCPRVQVYASKIVLRCYKFILAAHWRCTFGALAHAIGMTEDGNFDDGVNASIIKELTANILVENGDGLIQFAHASAQDYLERKDGGSAFSSPVFNAEAAKICLIALRHIQLQDWNSA